MALGTDGGGADLTVDQPLGTGSLRSPRYAYYHLPSMSRKGARADKWGHIREFGHTCEG